MRHRVQFPTPALSDLARRQAAGMMLDAAELIDRMIMRLFWLGLLPPLIVRLAFTTTSALARASLRLVGFRSRPHTR